MSEDEMEKSEETILESSAESKKRGKKFEYFSEYTPGKKVEPYIYWSKTLYKHYDVHFYLVIGGNQISRKSSSIKNKRDAQKILKEFQQELWGKKLKEKKNDRTWRAAKDRAYKELQKIIDTKTGSSLRLIQVREALELHTKVWDDLYLSDFSADQIRSHFVDALNKNTEKPLTLSTKNKIIGHISKVFIANGWGENNPAKGLKPVGWSDRQKKRRLEAGLSIEEALKLIDHTTKINSPWRWVYLWGLGIGARSGELWSLKFSNVVRDANGEPVKIKIERSYCWRTKKEKLPKNNETRTVPLNKTLVETLKYLEKNKFDEFYILPRIPEWKYGKASEKLREFLIELKIIEPIVKRKKTDEDEIEQSPKDYFRFHDLRATFISIGLDQTKSLKSVAEIVGHRSLSSTNHYLRKTNDAELQKVVDSLDFDIRKPNNIESIDKHRKNKKKIK